MASDDVRDNDPQLVGEGLKLVGQFDGAAEEQFDSITETARAMMKAVPSELSIMTAIRVAIWMENSGYVKAPF